MYHMITCYYSYRIYDTVLMVRITGCQSMTLPMYMIGYGRLD